MIRLATLMLAMLASLLLYAAAATQIQRPLTIGEIPTILNAKLVYASSLPSPKIVVFAGSNGRYSHRCESITQASGWPCANLSLAVGIGLDFQFDGLLQVLQPGDVVYMPLEYGQYAVSRDEMQGGTENTLLLQYFRDRLWRLDAARIVRAHGSFDLPFLVHGVIEMALAARGHQRRSGAASLTPQGDERGHTREAGLPYREFLRVSRYAGKPLPADTHAMQVIGRFLDVAGARGVRVYGGLPTVPDDAVVAGETVERITALFAEHGQTLLSLPNASRYPLDCFFDTLSHLNEHCQIGHSLAVGALLHERLPARQAP